MKKILAAFLFSLIFVYPVYSATVEKQSKNKVVDYQSVRPNKSPTGITIKDEYIFKVKTYNDGSESFNKLEKDFQAKIPFCNFEYAIRCSENTFTIVSWNCYSVDGKSVTKGELPSRQYNNKDYKWQEIGVGSHGATWARHICTAKK